MTRMAFFDEALHAQRRSFNRTSFCNSEDEDDKLFERFEQCQTNFGTSPTKPAWFDASRGRASTSPRHVATQTNMMVPEISLGPRECDDNNLPTLRTLLEKTPSSSPLNHAPSPTRSRLHRAHRCIAESIAAMPTTLETPESPSRDA